MPRDHVQEILRWVVDSSPAEQTEAVLVDTRSYLTRFTKNAVHQNVGTRDTHLGIRVIEGRRVGTYSTNLLTAGGGERALKRALEIARLQRPLAADLELPGPEHTRPVQTWCRSTAECGPGDRVDRLQPIFAAAGGRQVELAGALRTEEAALGVANSRGVDVWQDFSSAELNLLADASGALGHAYQRARDVEDLDLSSMEERASKKALDGREPEDLEPGRYDVVLEPAAVASLVTWLGPIAFGARSVEQGTSFLAGREGEPVMGPEITFFDDGLEDEETATPFDFEGVPKSRVMLVRKGKAGRPVLDSYYAGRMGRPSTGHASGTGGHPMPLNLYLEAGESTLEELIGKIENGLLVTRFHYVNGLLEPRKARMTGMTKDGTFRIRNGAITGPVRNLRFNESVTEAFSRVIGLSQERERHAFWVSWTGGITVPAVALKEFRFTGTA